jgi:hypothetical protein
MALSHSTGLSNTSLGAGIATAFDGGNGRIAIYSGTMPSAVTVSGKNAAANAAATGTLLATFTLPSDVFAAAASGAIALNAVSSVTGAANGTAGYFIMYLSTGTALTSNAGASDVRLMGTVATSGGDMTIDNASIATGATVAMSGWTYNHAP